MITDDPWIYSKKRIMSNTISETLNCEFNVSNSFLFDNDKIPQTPEKEFEEPWHALDLNVGPTCPLAPNQGKTITESFFIKLSANIMARIFEYMLQKEHFSTNVIWYWYLLLGFKSPSVSSLASLISPLVSPSSECSDPSREITASSSIAEGVRGSLRWLVMTVGQCLTYKF